MAACKAIVSDPHIIVTVPPRMKQLGRKIPGGRWDALKGAWKYPITEPNAKAVEALFGPVDGDEIFMTMIPARKEPTKLEVEDDTRPIKSKTQAWQHQRRAFWFCHDKPGAMLGMEMGCGKSKVATDLIIHKGHQKTLILCPKSVVRGVWPGEFDVHAAEPCHVVPLYKGTVAKKTEQLKAEMLKAEKEKLPFVAILNYESAWREPFATASLKIKWDCVVLDESHRVKSPGGKASRYCAKLGKVTKQRLCLTGTPMAHGPLDLYGQYRFLDPSIYGTNYAVFRSRYAIMGGFEDKQVIGYMNKEELMDKFYSIGFVVKKDDVLDLPEQIHTYRTFELGPKSRRVYNDLENEFIAGVENGEITVSNALTKLLRLQQITGGYVETDDGDAVELENGKQALLTDILEDLAEDEPIVVFARFTSDLKAIRDVCKKAGRSYGELSGQENKLQEFRDGKFSVLGVQIQAGGVGVNLTRARYNIYYSLGFSLTDYEQSLSRSHRPGQKRNVQYIHLLAEKTVDQKVYRALKNRKNVIEDLLRFSASL